MPHCGQKLAHPTVPNSFFQAPGELRIQDFPDLGHTVVHSACFITCMLHDGAATTHENTLTFLQQPTLRLWAQVWEPGRANTVELQVPPLGAPQPGLLDPSTDPSGGWPTLVAVGSGALASPFPSPAPSLCLGLCAVCPSRPAWLALAPTPLSSSAVPCPARAPAHAPAPVAGAPALGLAHAPAPAHAVCSLALFPFPVPLLKSQAYTDTSYNLNTCNGNYRENAKEQANED